MKLYKQYVRPHLEFCTQVWSPWAEKDKACLEKVQQRAVKMVSGLANESYEERLKELDMDTLEERRHQADMVMVHKIIHGKGHLDQKQWFDLAGDAVRATRSTADPLSIQVKHGRLDQRSKFFSIRVIEGWNNVPSELKSEKRSE